jgi:hypothetical protein
MSDMQEPKMYEKMCLKLFHVSVYHVTHDWDQFWVIVSMAMNRFHRRDGISWLEQLPISQAGRYILFDLSFCIKLYLSFG